VFFVPIIGWYQILVFRASAARGIKAGDECTEKTALTLLEQIMRARLLLWLPVWLAAAFTPSAPGPAQTTPSSLAGTYNGNESEVESELRLEPNGRFKYYLSYGALDETSEGTWTADANGIVLTSDPVKSPIIQYLGYEGGRGSTVTITLEAPQQLPWQLFSVLVLHADGKVAQIPFDSGSLQLPLTGADAPRKIAVAFPLYQVASPPYDISPAVGAIHFRFVPNDLGKIAFDHHRLPWDSDGFDLNRFGKVLHFHKEAPGESARP
jgi:hypothetical protein